MSKLPEDIELSIRHNTSESSYFLGSERQGSTDKFEFSQRKSWLARLKSNPDDFYVAVSTCTISAIIFFLLNLFLFVWATAHHGFPPNGRQWLYRGNCTTAQRLNSGFHLVINALTTLLLSSSGYCMQYLSAPTRQDVSRAHARGRWLDIGVLSVRNVLTMGTKRVVLWAVLGATSLTLHLFCNSMLFVTYTTNTYWTLQVSSTFVSDPTGPFQYHPTPNISATEPMFMAEVQRMSTLLREGVLGRMEPIECIDSYNVRYQIKYGSVLLVSNDSTAIVHDDCHWECLNDSTCPVGAPVHLCESVSNSAWMCDSDYELYGEISTCLIRASELRKTAGDWKPNPGTDLINPLDGSIATEYCLAEKKEGLCFVQGSPHVAFIVLATTLAKAAAMFVVSRRITNHALVTISDAISSFLDAPDSYTQQMCLASYADFRRMRRTWDQRPRIYNQTRTYCFSITGKVRWMACISLYALAIGLGLYYLDPFHYLHDMVSFGFGTSSVAILQIFPDDGAVDHFLAQILAANSFQVVLALLYFMTNGFVTIICVQYEWSSYAESRKGLRVSTNKRGEQRSTYFLQIPYRFSVPLLTIFGILHWLASESIFVVDEAVELSETKEILESSSHLGISPLVAYVGLSIMTAMLFYVIAQGFWIMKLPMPMLRSCSAVIAAACHLDQNAKINDSHLEKVRWGVECDPTLSFDGSVGHCGFSTGYVETPVEGRLYA